HRVDDQYAGAIFRLDQRGTASGRSLGIVDGPNEPRSTLDEDHRFPLIPRMIAERDRVGASLDQFLIDGFGDAKSTGGVLAIDHHEIKSPLLHELGQAFVDNRPAAAAHHVPNKKYAHLSTLATVHHPLLR